MAKADKAQDARARQRDQSAKLTEAIEQKEKLKEMRKFQEEWNRRIPIVRAGRIAYEKKNPIEAIKQYKNFLRVTAKRFECDIGDLKPDMFQKHIRVTEALIISSLCFDLAKIFDRVGGDEASRERRMYLKLFVNFSKGMPFQMYVAQNVKRFLDHTSNIRHPGEFKKVYSALGGGAKCFIATAVFEDPLADELYILREFRDQYLLSNAPGRIFVRTYYRIGPSLANFVIQRPRLKKATQILLHKFSSKIKNKLH